MDMIETKEQESRHEATSVDLLDSLVSILDISGQLTRTYPRGRLRPRPGEDYLRTAQLRTLKATLDQNSAMTRTFLAAFNDLSQDEARYDRQQQEAIAVIVSGLLDNKDLVEALRGRVMHDLAKTRLSASRHTSLHDVSRLCRRWAKDRTSR